MVSWPGYRERLAHSWGSSCGDERGTGKVGQGSSYPVFSQLTWARHCFSFHPRGLNHSRFFPEPPWPIGSFLVAKEFKAQGPSQPRSSPWEPKGRGRRVGSTGLGQWGRNPGANWNPGFLLELGIFSPLGKELRAWAPKNFPKVPTPNGLIGNFGRPPGAPKPNQPPGETRGKPGRKTGCTNWPLEFPAKRVRLGEERRRGPLDQLDCGPLARPGEKGPGWGPPGGGFGKVPHSFGGRGPIWPFGILKKFRLVPPWKGNSRGPHTLGPRVKGSESSPRGAMVFEFGLVNCGA